MSLKKFADNEVELRRVVLAVWTQLLAVVTQFTIFRRNITIAAIRFLFPI